MALELFDSRGRFKMPSPEQVAKLDDATRQRFEAVQQAALANEAAAAATKVAKDRVENAVVFLRSAEENLRTLRPPISAVANVKAWIASQR